MIEELGCSRAPPTLSPLPAPQQLVSPRAVQGTPIPPSLCWGPSLVIPMSLLGDPPHTHAPSTGFVGDSRVLSWGTPIAWLPQRAPCPFPRVIAPAPLSGVQAGGSCVLACVVLCFRVILHFRVPGTWSNLYPATVLAAELYWWEERGKVIVP